MDWDVFISHAWEDKESLARPLAKALEEAGLRVWYDEFALDVGDSLRRSIDRGLANSKYGIVILSLSFFKKEWPQKELDGLVARESHGEKVILPVWHNLTADEVRQYSPMLADRLAVSSSRGLEYVVAELLRAARLQTSPSLSTRRTPFSFLQRYKLLMLTLIGIVISLTLLGVSFFGVFGHANRPPTTTTTIIAAVVDKETPTATPIPPIISDIVISKTITLVAVPTFTLASTSATRPRTATPTRTATVTPTSTSFKYPAPLLRGGVDYIALADSLYTADGRLIAWDFPFPLVEDEWYEVSAGALEGVGLRAIAWVKEKSYTILAKRNDPPAWVGQVIQYTGAGESYVCVYVHIVRGKDGKWQGDLSPSSKRVCFGA